MVGADLALGLNGGLTTMTVTPPIRDDALWPMGRAAAAPAPGVAGVLTRAAAPSIRHGLVGGEVLGSPRCPRMFADLEG